MSWQPHILYITYGNMFRTTGFAEQVRAELVELSKRTYRVSLLAFENYTAFGSQSEGKRELASLCRRHAIRLITMPIFAEARPSIWPIREALDKLTMAVISRLGGVDIIHAHNVNIARMACRVGKWMGIPVVADLHGVAPHEYLYLGNDPEDPVYQRLKRSECRAAVDSQAVFVVSEPFRRYLVDEYGIDEGKVSITRSSVDTQAFQFSESARNRIRDEHAIGDRPVFLFIGSVQHYHVFDEVLCFFSKIRETFPDALLAVLTTQVDATRSLIAQNGLADHTLVTRVAHHQVPEWLSAADWGILLREPSFVNAVASPVKFSEYMACGLPVVISDGIGDLSHFVFEKNLGYVVVHLNEDVYEHAAKWMKSRSPASQVARRKRCREFAENELSWERCMLVFDSAYHQIAPHLFGGG